MILCQKGLTWNIANGNHINFWMEPWLGPNLIMRNHIEGPLLRNEHTSILTLYVSKNSINLTKLPFELPSNLHNLLCNFYIPTLTNKTSYDHLYWGS